MPIVNASDLLRHARQNRCGLAAFTPLNLEILAGIIDGAEQAAAPVVLTPRACADGVPLELLMPAVVAAARRATVPVAIHIGGLASGDAAARAVRLGANSIAAGNRGDAREVAAIARACGVTAEAAVAAGTAAPEAAALIAGSRAEILAIEAAGETGPALDPAWYAALGEAVGVPLALDGAPPSAAGDCRRLIAHGVARFGCDAALAAALRREPAGHDPHDLREAARTMRRVAQRAAREACEQLGAQGLAAGAAADCRPWREVEHLIIYNVREGMDEDAVRAMMARGREELAAIPGVRRVFTGRAVRADAAYRYCWLVRFCDEAVIPTYRDHPDHVAFADGAFRPVAADRISIDYTSIEQE